MPTLHRRRLLFSFAIVALVAIAFFNADPAGAQGRDMPPGARVFYNPFPLEYDSRLVKVIDGLEPGVSNLREAVDRYGEPHLISQNTYFYWDIRHSENIRQIRMSFFPPKDKWKPKYEICGFDGRAVIREIRCFDARRMGYSTYLSDMVNFTPFPYVLKYYATDRRYEMQFYEQGYSMYFDGENEQFLFEAYYPHQDLTLRGVYYLKLGTGGFLYVEESYLY